MKRALQGVLVLLVLSAVGLSAYYFLKEEPACTEPLTYRVGTVDARFGVSEAAFKDMLQEAAVVWNEASGKSLLTFSEDGEIPVSLVYDERQAAVVLGDTISSEQVAYDRKRATVDLLIKQHEDATRAHEANVASFDAAVAAYEESVAYWNAQGGAPPEEFRKLETERRRLSRLESDINAAAIALNTAGEKVNREVAALNALAERVNAKVETYNTVAGEEFDQGQYVSDESGTRITIYEFETKEQLRRALAHEFGHALGIGHTESPQSLMYPYNAGNNLTLHAEDVAALRAACGFE